MKIRYSHSKRDLLRRCNRCFYYEYYAATLRPASNVGSLFDVLEPVPKPRIDPARVAAIRRLKSLRSCPLAAGNILHQLIAAYLRKNLGWSVDWFVKEAGKRFDEMVNYSRDPSGNRWMLAQNPQLGVLLEFHYRRSDAEQRAKQNREKLAGAVQRFFNTPAIRDLCCRIPPETRLVEAPVSGIAGDDWIVGGRVDLAGCAGGRVEVIDWKIGRQSGHDDSLQLITYGWWASRYYHVEPTNVCVRRVFLGDGTIEDGCVLSKSLIECAEARIIQDVELIKDLHTYGQSGNEEAFTPCGKANVCQNCKYQEECPEGRSVTSSRPTSDSLSVMQANR